MSDLAKVREKIARGWTQEAFARDANGREIAFGGNKNAVCWCLGGAAEAAQGIVRDIDKAQDARDILATALGFDAEEDMATWNDEVGRTQAEVLARIDDAIARQVAS